MIELNIASVNSRIQKTVECLKMDHDCSFDTLNQETNQNCQNEDELKKSTYVSLKPFTQDLAKSDLEDSSSMTNSFEISQNLMSISSL